MTAQVCILTAEGHPSLERQAISCCGWLVCYVSGESSFQLLFVKPTQTTVSKLRVYRQDCETFGMVVKMLIEKDPSLEKSIQFALRQNLHEIGERCVEELKRFITEGAESFKSVLEGDKAEWAVSLHNSLCQTTSVKSLQESVLRTLGQLEISLGRIGLNVSRPRVLPSGVPPPLSSDITVGGILGTLRLSACREGDLLLHWV
ncbi:hypothetical protein MC885_010131 [Smutsia gigantea]|nr:hypothetical protein MC885_010131 [Smutsia gigantea]